MKETQENQKKLAVKVLADKMLIAKSRVSERILELAITAPEKENSTAKIPLNLSLVIDRSGSMEGEKLEYAKRAAMHVVDLLSEQDRVAIVVYDDTIEVLFPSAFMTAENKRVAKQKIAPITSRASTNLFGGWLKGCEQVAEAATERSFNRTLLLTDGQANVGITSIGELSHHARELFSRGVSTSCFGIGTGYDEHILEAMASFGGGNFHFLETINAIPVVFEREFLELVSISLRDIKIYLTLPTEIKAAVSGGYQAVQTDNILKIRTGSVAAGQTQYIYVRLTTPKNLTCAESTIQVKINAGGEDNQPLEEEASVTFSVVPDGEEKSQKPDKTLMERFAMVDMADKANEALKLERAGDRIGSSQLLRNSANSNAAYMSSSESRKYAHMSDMFESGLDERSRKVFHQRSYQSKKGRGLVLDYHIQMVKGCLLADIDDHAVLVDSGSPTSAGMKEEWMFFDRLYQLPKKAMDVNLIDLNKYLGRQVDVLMGMDILRDLYVTVDLNNERIEFNQVSPLSREQGFNSTVECIPFKFVSGVPICQGVISEKSVDFIFDTGSKLTYLEQHWLDNLPKVGKETDFYPGIGSFATDIVQLPLKLGKQQLMLKCAKLPSKREAIFTIYGADGVLGTEIFKLSKVCLAFPDGELMLIGRK